MALRWNNLGLLLLTTVLGVAIGVIRGPKDPRYPDYIVEPKITCVKEGVFPHPRNCSWYYRCVDRNQVGYYQTYYFECEPGTVFADELDQCVFPFLTNTQCESKSPITITTVIVQETTNYVSTPVNTVALPPTSITSNVPSIMISTAPSTTVIARPVSTIVPGQIITILPSTSLTTSITPPVTSTSIPPPDMTTSIPPTIITTSIPPPDMTTSIPLPVMPTTTVIVGDNIAYFTTPVNTVQLPVTTLTSHVPASTAIIGLPTTVIAPSLHTVVPGQVTLVYPYPLQQTLTTVIIGGISSLVETSFNTLTSLPITITSNVLVPTISTGLPTTVIYPPVLSTVVPGQVTSIVPARQASTTVIYGTVSTVVTEPYSTLATTAITIITNVPSTTVVTVTTTLIEESSTTYISLPVTTYVPNSLMVQPTASVPAQTTTNIPTGLSINCRAGDRRPLEDWTKQDRNNCEKCKLCNNPGQPPVSVRLCENYYICERAQNGQLTANLTTCNEQLYYNYDKDKCMMLETMPLCPGTYCWHLNGRSQIILEESPYF